LLNPSHIAWEAIWDRRRGVWQREELLAVSRMPHAAGEVPEAGCEG